jgi:hypothetical protein
MKSLPYSTFQEANRIKKSRNLALFGAGNIAQKTLRRLEEKPSFILDNSPNLWGEIQEGVKIVKPSVLSDSKDSPFIIICTTSFREVSEQLIDFGLQPEQDFIVSPILNDLRVVDEIQSVKVSMLVTSGAPSAKLGLSEGGVYRIDIDGADWNLTKVIDGSAHGIIRKDEGYVLVEDKLGIVELDKDLKILRSVELPLGSRGHGISWSAERESYFIACSYLDQVLQYSEDMQYVRSYDISLKSGNGRGPHHHINDCYAFGTSIYVSMFSVTGNWKQEIFDGGVVEIDLDSGQRVGNPVRNLWMPHNITMMQGEFVVLDSLRGTVLGNNMQEMGKFPGFTRGFAYDGSYLYIGQSRNRNFSRQLGISNNISIDSGIVIFDERTKVSRTIQLPLTVTEIHGISLIK